MKVTSDGESRKCAVIAITSFSSLFWGALTYYVNLCQSHSKGTRLKSTGSKNASLRNPHSASLFYLLPARGPTAFPGKANQPKDSVWCLSVAKCDCVTYLLDCFQGIIGSMRRARGEHGREGEKGTKKNNFSLNALHETEHSSPADEFVTHLSYLAAASL